MGNTTSQLCFGDVPVDVTKEGNGKLEQGTKSKGKQGERDPCAWLTLNGSPKSATDATDAKQIKADEAEVAERAHAGRSAAVHREIDALEEDYRTKTGLDTTEEPDGEDRYHHETYEIFLAKFNALVMDCHEIEKLEKMLHDMEIEVEGVAMSKRSMKECQQLLEKVRVALATHRAGSGF